MSNLQEVIRLKKYLTKKKQPALIPALTCTRKTRSNSLSTQRFTQITPTVSDIVFDEQRRTGFSRKLYGYRSSPQYNYIRITGGGELSVTLFLLIAAFLSCQHLVFTANF